MGVACRPACTPHTGACPTMRWPPFSAGLGSLSWLFICSIVLLNTTGTSAADCNLIGKGACRGEGWSEGAWPISLGKQSLEDCCQKCGDKEGCSGLSISKTGECFLFGHKKLVPASALGGECYSCSSSGKNEAGGAPKAEGQKPKEDKKIKDDVKKQAKKEEDDKPVKKIPESKPETKKQEKKAEGDKADKKIRQKKDNDDDDDDDDKPEKKIRQKKDDDDDDDDDDEKPKAKAKVEV